MNHASDKQQLRSCWQRTLPADCDWDTLSSDQSYRPPLSGAASESSLFEATGALDADATYKTPYTLALPAEGPDPSQGSFEKLEEIGRGGMGVVYRARQHSLGRDVALKQQLEVRGGLPVSRLARRAFVTEARVNGGLDHPNIVPVYELGHDGEGAFLAMKLVEGRAWKELLREQPDALSLHLETLSQVCNAVAFAHSRGIAHNDLKPENVMLGAFGEVLVMDWGLAVHFRDTPEALATLRHKSSIKAPCGTPAYMPPELAQGQGGQIGPWTDIYLLGAILYEILTGRPPHSRGNFLESIAAAAVGVVAPVAEEHPAELRALCAWALHPDSASRPASVRVFQRELSAYRQHKESLRIARLAADRLAGLQPQAETELVRKQRSALYQGFAATVAGFEQALELWQENPGAREGAESARLAYAQAALAQGDLGLAETQAEELGDDSEATAVRAAIVAAQRRRKEARKTARRLRSTLAGVLLVAFAGLLVGIVLTLQANREILAQNSHITAQNLEIAEKNRAIEAEQRATEAQRLMAEARGRVAERALNDLLYQVEERLVREGSPSSHRLARAILRSALDGYQELRSAEPETPRGDLGSARAQTLIARLVMFLDGDAAQARQLLQTAEQALLGLLDGEGGVQAAFQLAGVEIELARLHHSQASLDDALEAGTRAVIRLQGPRLADGGVASQEEKRRRLLAEGLWLLGRILSDRGSLQEARRLLEQSLEQRPGQVSVMLELADVQHKSGDIFAARAVYQQCLATMRRHYALSPDDTLLEQQLCHVLESLAGIQQAHLELTESVSSLQEALQRRRGLADRDPANAQHAKLLARCLTALAEAQLFQGELEAAQQLCLEADALQAGLAERGLQGAELASQMAETWETRARVAELRGDPAAALEAWNHTLALGPDEPSEGTELLQRAEALRSRGVLRREIGALGASRGDFDASLALLETLLEREADHGQALRARAQGLSDRARVDLEEGALQPALRDSAEAEEIFRELASRGDDARLRPPGQGPLSDLAVCLGARSALLAKSGESGGAVRAANESVQLLRRIAEPGQHHAATRGLAFALGQRGELLARLGQTSGARRDLEEALQLYLGLVAAAPDDLRSRRAYGLLLIELADLDYASGANSVAAELYEAALAELEVLLQGAPESSAARRHWLLAVERAAQLRLEAGNVAAALELLRPARDLAELSPGLDGALDGAWWAEKLAAAEDQAGNSGPARQARVRAVARLHTELLEAAAHPRRAEAWFQLAVLHSDLGEREAERTSYQQAAILSDSLGLHLRSPQAQHERAALASGLGAVCRELGDFEGARQAFEQGRALLSRAAFPGADELDQTLHTQLWELTKHELFLGVRSPQTAEERLSLGFMQLSRGETEAARVSVRQAFEAPELQSQPQAWLSAAREIAPLAEDDPALQDLALEMLAGYLELWRAEVARLQREEPDGEELQLVLGARQQVRELPELQNLRGLAGFGALFDED